MQDSRSPASRAARSARPLAAVAAVASLVVVGFVPADRDFDIAVSGVTVHATQNGTPVSPVQSGNPGREYYLNCGFTPSGSGGPSAVQFRFLANGQVVRDVYAPVNPGQYVAMGAFWTPTADGTYTLVCQANPAQSFPETTYANNTKTVSFAVQASQLDPSAVSRVPPFGRRGPQEGFAEAAAETPAAAMPDIRVHGLDVRPVDDLGYPQASNVSQGYPGRTYYMHCVMDPVGPLTSPSVRFIFTVNGEIVRDVYAPVQSGKPVDMGWKWTPQAGGEFMLLCHANPDQAFSEATYYNNAKRTQFPVFQVIPAEAAVEAGPVGRPSGPGRGEKQVPDEQDGGNVFIEACPECFNPQPEPPKIRIPPAGGQPTPTPAPTPPSPPEAAGEAADEIEARPER